MWSHSIQGLLPLPGGATIDGLVVAAAALAGGGCVLTGDPADLEKLAAALPTSVIQIASL